MRVRVAQPQDAAGIGAVHVASWEGAYRGVAPDGWLEAQTVDAQTDQWRQILGPESRSIVLVAETAEDDQIVGFCAASAPSRDADADEDTAEISTLYVDPGRWRRGAGRALMDAMLAELTRRGFEQVTLWVLEPNVRARGFYAACGFAQDGARHDLGAGWPPDLRVRRTLTDG